MPVDPLPLPLLLTGDPELLDDVLRLGAAAGVELTVAADVAAARRAWSLAPLVLVGGDLAQALAASAPPRRPDVVVVSHDLDDAAVWRRAVGVGAEHVVFLPDGEAWLVERLAEGVERGLGDAVTVCVIGGRGGAGATTLAAALALAGTDRSRRTLLVDGDPLGGGIDMVIGGEDAVGMRWPDLAATRGRVSGPALRAALPEIGGLTVLSWDRSSPLSIPVDAMRALLTAGRRSNDLVVVDLPRRLDAAAEEALAHCTLTLLVVPAEIRAVAAAARVAAAVSLHTADLRAIVRGPAPSGLTGAMIADSLALPLAGEMRAEPGLAGALERGEPPARRGKGPLARMCAGLLDALPAPGRAAAA